MIEITHPWDSELTKDGWSSAEEGGSQQSPVTAPQGSRKRQRIDTAEQLPPPEPQAPRAESQRWFSKHPGMPNKTEVLFAAFLVAALDRPAPDVDAWARHVAQHEKEVEEQWATWFRPTSWKFVGIIPSYELSLMHAAMTQSYSSDFLEQLGLAMQSWCGDGAREALREWPMRNYLREKDPPRCPKPPGSKHSPPPRWQGGMAVLVAAFIKRHRVALRKALRLDYVEEELPTLNKQQQVIGKLQSELEYTKSSLTLVQTAHRKLKSYHADQRASKKDAVQKERFKVKDMKEQVEARAQKKVSMATEKMKERLKLAKARMRETVRGELAGELATSATWRNRANKRARDAESKLKRANDLAKKRLCRAEEAEIESSRYKDVLKDALDAKERFDALTSRVSEMPSWRPIRGKGAGRGAAKLEFGYRVSIWEMLSYGTPASAVGKSIVAVVKRTAPWLDPIEVTVTTVHKARFELRTAEECMSGRRVASAFRVRQLGFDETTKFQDPSAVTSVLINPTEGAAGEVVVMRAAYATGGGTAEHVAKAIEDKVFARARDHLHGWEATCKRMFPDHVWTGPDPERCGLQRLGGGGCVISDTCSTARKTQRLLVEEIGKQVESKYDPELWAQKTQDEREQEMRVHTTHCWNHIRNIFSAAMSKAMSKHVAEALEEFLSNFSSFERMSTDFDNLLRAQYKEFHHGGRYYKGHGKTFLEWLVEWFPQSFVMHVERAEAGRQDLDFDASIAMYINRAFMVKFLDGRVFAANHNNQLEDFLYYALRCLEYVAMMRANGILDLLIMRPLRWLSGKAATLSNWSPASMGKVLEMLEDLFERAGRDGRVIMDLRPQAFWKPYTDEHPAFREWMEHMFDKEVTLSPDRTVKHKQFELAYQELVNPTDETNIAANDLTLEYLAVQARAAIMKLHDSRTVLPEYLPSQGGKMTFANQQQSHADTQGCEASNDKFAESVFGTFDRMLKRNLGISREAASGLTQSMHHKSFSLGDHVKRRKQHEPPPPGIGYFYSLPTEEQKSLVEYCRATRVRMRQIDAEHNAEVVAYKKEKVKTSSEHELQALIVEYGYALSFFDRWKQRGVRTFGEMTRALKSMASVQEQLDWLREQVEMRTRGLQWVEFRTQWSSSSDEHVGTIPELTGHLKLVIEEEKTRRNAGELPDHAPAPIFKRKSFKELGTLTPQGEQLSGRHTQLTADELLHAAMQERERLEANGQIDRISDQQPSQAPAFDELLGRKIEVRWRYWAADETEKSKRKSIYIWCTGEVIEVADGRTTRRSERCKSVLPWGAVRIRWPEDSEFEEGETFVWSVLKPSDFNKDVHLGWRYDASELAAMSDK